MFVKILNDEQIDKIHQKTLYILENIGVVVHHENYGNWLKTGAIGMEKRCRIRKEEILSKHKTEPLADDIKTDLEKVIENVKKNLTT